ncbi:MAG: Insecticidal toxin complex protein TccC [Pseudomonas helleri]|jgi:insecticidal toxin complex protein TccC|uniref:RHS repeat-associated core domain-containing protein n=2 Tax=Pseudomonas helleri TaxID=1608996 RepID=UPI003A0FDC9F
MTTLKIGLHQYTPCLLVTDPRGLVVRSIAHHRQEVEEPIAERVQRQVFNANGHLCQQWDPRLFELSDLANQSTRYSLSGQALLSESVDAGWRLACHDAAGQLRDSWDGRDTHRRFTYDELMRPVNVFENEPPLCVQRFTYAGADEEDARHNRCGQMLRHDDQAGSLWHDAFALTGQPLSEARQFCTALTSPQWPASEADLEDTAYTTRWRHDALGAVIEQIDALEHVQRFEFDVAGQPFASWLDDVALLKSTTYNALGRVEIELAGNDVTTTAHYSARDGLLSNIKAKRSDGKTLQDLHYQYDPVGNITRIEDLAQPVQWFAGQRIQAVSTYAYDTLYQLISATGRENASQTIGPNLPGLEIFGPVDDSRWRTYSQTYSYDSGGNLTWLKHAAGAGNSYTREMVVDARSNRSLFKDGSPLDFAKAFDANGNQQALAPGQLMQWDSRNQLQHVTQVQREDPDGQDDDTETYVYDGGGQRVRKVRRAKTRGGEHISEVRYLPGLEIRSRTSGEQLHVVLAQAGRNAVRLLNRENGQHQHRYSVNDHLGSSTLELDQNGELLSQESYYPYGGTAWWAAKSTLEARYKVVRYSGKERDATGLYYYGFRYYAPWLQRWINPDPAGDVDGLNHYRFVANSPIRLTDNDGRNFEDAIVKTPYRRKESSGRFLIRTLGALNTSLAAEVAFSDEIDLTEVHPLDMSEYVNRFDALSMDEKAAIRGWSSIGDAFEYHDFMDSDDYPDALSYELNQHLAENKSLDKKFRKAYVNLQSSISKLTIDKAVLLRTDEYAHSDDIPWGKTINKGDIVSNQALLMAVSESNSYAQTLTDSPEKETTTTLAHYLIKNAEAAPLVYGIASPVLEEYERLIAPHTYFEVEDIAYAEKIDTQGRAVSRSKCNSQLIF